MMKIIARTKGVYKNAMDNGSTVFMLIFWPRGSTALLIKIPTFDEVNPHLKLWVLSLALIFIWAHSQH